jgi:predicted HicB family RNase H-like nuclease
MKAADRYLKIVEWSEEDGCYVGTCPGLLRGGVHGGDEAKVYRELCRAVDEALDLYKRDKKPLPEATAGKEYSGKFVLRVGKDLHKAVSIRALQAGDSLNSYCQKVLRSALTKHAPA